ncbi:hypothetical protein HELRODRAFT_167309 [Helobdella robusta]|uniref:Syndecan/Neurexin domain-containing protein n=1 Tax=Helobdella robusta TaxID=6412 RepID=T1EZ88_HELRO|nr:hypothetical protein HELRODRAFT_167309 [Helobdella robusta]ESO10810.1 hypothetical protein HELRODRAFT_167309 [Helobdella robusta]
MKLLFGLVLLLSVALGIHAASKRNKIIKLEIFISAEQNVDEGTPALGPPQASASITKVDSSTNTTTDFKQDAAPTTTTAAPQNDNTTAAATGNEAGVTAAAVATSNETQILEVSTQSPPYNLNTENINSANDSTSPNDNKTDSATTEIIPTTVAPAENATGTNPGLPAKNEGRHFDLTSFFGGILLCFFIVALVLLAIKCFGKKKDYQPM